MAHHQPLAMLNLDWQHTGRSPAARRAIRRWAQLTPVLGQYVAPADAVDDCAQHCDRAGKDAVFAALVVNSSRDPLAARTALQALLPGLVTAVRRGDPHGRLVGPGRPFATHDDLYADLLSFAYERLRTADPTDTAWAARRIIDSAWMRIRTAGRVHRRRAGGEVLNAIELPDRHARPERTAAEHVTRIIVTAIENGTVNPNDAAILYTNRVLGHRIYDLARITGRHEAVLRRERDRAQAALAAAS
jgi:hypothetical protein